MSSAPSRSESLGPAEQAESSDEANSSSVSRQGVSEHEQPISRKRKFNEDDERSASKRQESFLYHSKYHDLYNAIVKEVNYPVNTEHLSKWRPGRIGLSYWSSEEKEAFFVALDKKGRDDIKGISYSIGSKSEFEVRSFILGLQQGLAENVQDESHLRIPIAFEISEQCEKELDIAAKGLAQRQLAVEEEIEQRRHEYWWLLDHDTAAELEAFLNKDVLAISYQGIESAARLFNVEQMIELSSKFFMNSKDMNDNWTTLLNEKSSPGIYGTALVDLYNLIVEIIRRVVASSVFLAESRHRLQKNPARRASRANLRKQDIESACQLLGLNCNRKAYWIGLARRCNFDVYNRPVFSFTSQTPLSYDEVEQRLALGKHSQQGETKSVMDNNYASATSSIEEVATMVRSNDLNYESEETEEDELEHLDAIASQHEEIRLWKIVGKDISSSAIDPNETLADSSNEVEYRIEIAKDWRSKFQYKPPWQPSTDLRPERPFIATMDASLRDSANTAEALSINGRQSSASIVSEEESSESENLEEEDSDNEEGSDL